MFTPEHSLLRISIPFRPPGPSSHPASHSSRPATLHGQPPHPARPPTRPATQPGPPPGPVRHPALPATRPVSCLPAFPGSLASLLNGPLQPRLSRERCDSCLLQRLCVGGASQCENPSNILRTPSKNLRTPSKILRTPSRRPKIYVPHLKF